MKFHYPSEARFRCHNSGFCCQSFKVLVTEKEKKELEQLPLVKKIPELKGKELLEPFTSKEVSYTLKMDKENRCTFLDEKKHCKIHSTFSAKKKPFSCQLYPYTFVAAPDGVYVGIKFSCPSVAEAKGPLLKKNRTEIEALFTMQQQNFHLPQLPEQIQIGEKKLSWKEIKELEALLEKTLRYHEVPFSQRILTLLEIFSMTSRYVSGDDPKSRIEFWKILTDGIWKRMKENKDKPQEIKKLKNSQRKIYLQMIYYFSQPTGRSTDLLRGVKHSKPTLRSKFEGLQFIHNLGSFKLPFTEKTLQVGNVMEKMKLLEKNPTLDEILERYFLTKLQSQSFYGPAFHEYSFEDGLNNLVLIYPILCWYSYAYCIAEGREVVEAKDLIKAIRCVDYSYEVSSIFKGVGANFNIFWIKTLAIPHRFKGWAKAYKNRVKRIVNESFLFLLGSQN